MSLIENYAAERRARLVRLGAIPSRPEPRLTEALLLKPKPAKEIFVPPVEYFYPGMWFWDLIDATPRLPLMIKTIQEAVASDYNIPAIEMRSSRRTKNIVVPRWVAMYLSRQMLEMSLPQIGRHFGGRDHSTILHGIQQIEVMLETDFSLRNRMQRIAARFV
jgi:chromosomal replication initiator protein